MPQAAYSASYMYQRTPQIKLEDLIDANSFLKELMDFISTLCFPKLPDNGTEVEVVSFSDASFNISSSRSYGKTGLITRLQFKSKNGIMDI